MPVLWNRFHVKAIRKVVASTANLLLFHLIKRSLIYGIIIVMKRISRGEGAGANSRNLFYRPRNVPAAQGGNEENHPHDPTSLKNMKPPLENN